MALATVVALSVTGPGCRGQKPREAQEVTPELELTGVRFRVFRGDELRASGEAARVTLRRDTTELSASGLSAELPGPGRPDGQGVGAAPTRITAPEGRGLLKDRRFSASGGITVAQGDDVARTASARFEPSPGGGRVLGDERVVVEGQGYRLSGPGFELDPKQGEITIRGGARLEAGLAGAR